MPVMSRRRQAFALAAVDGAAWAVVVPAAVWLRFDLAVPQPGPAGVVQGLVIVLLGQWSLGVACGLYLGRYPVGGLDEAVWLAAVVLGAGALLLIADLVAPAPFLPRLVPVTAAVATLALCWAVRTGLRRRRPRTAPAENREERPRVDLLGVISRLPTVDPADLLGRPPVEQDVVGVGDSLAGRRVLVTGAGGSIGSELCEQVLRLDPAELFMLDRDESALHAVRLSTHGSALLDSPDLILADIRDPEAVRRAVAGCRPDIVFHAAALKHVPMLERFPLEAWQTNVLGTLNVLDAAAAAGVVTFVNISTDKAANPTSVLGRSKRIGERLVAQAGRATGGRYLSVRFGNVLGSRGSMLVTFVEQLTRGGPVTVTDPEATRYFMTIPEAVRLVLHAAAIGRPGEALVLDMGAPVRIADIATRLMRLSGRTAPIVYTGLRPGEKLHEELFGHGEWGDRPLHPAIAHITVPPMDPAWLAELAMRDGGVAAMVAATHEQRPAPASELGKTT